LLKMKNASNYSYSSVFFSLSCHDYPKGRNNHTFFSVSQLENAIQFG